MKKSLNHKILKIFIFIILIDNTHNTYKLISDFYEKSLCVFMALIIFRILVIGVFVLFLLRRSDKLM